MHIKIACSAGPGPSNFCLLSELALGAHSRRLTMANFDAPWLAQRPRRSGAQRRAQYDRGQARVIGSLLKSFATLQHRGCCNTKLGTALAQVLCAAPAAAAAAPAATAPYPVMPPGTFYAVEPSPAPQAMPIINFKGGVTVPLQATRVEVDYFLDVFPVPLRAISQPSLKTELFQVFYEGGEVDFIELCMSEGIKTRTQNEK